MKFLRFLKRHGVYIKIGFIIFLTGAVIAYVVYKKNSGLLNFGGGLDDAVTGSRIGELKSTADRIRDRDRESREALERTADRQRRISETIDRADRRVSDAQNRNDRIEEISRRTADRNREASELGNRAREILAEIRAGLN